MRDSISAATQAPSGPWAPPPDEELTWFRIGGGLPAHPRPLEYSFEVQAFAFGVSRALESSYFPLYEVRSRLIDGRLYLAAVPSAMAEQDLDGQLGRMRDTGLRFTCNLRGTWERAIRREVEVYNDAMSAFPPVAVTPAEVADGLLRLRRARANQWFAATRAVYTPVAMMQRESAAPPSEEATAVLEEARRLVRTRGTRLVRAALVRVGQRLAEAGRIEAPEEVWWLDLREVREALVEQKEYRATVAERRHRAARPRRVREATIGPPLPSDAPRMYLLKEVLALL